MGFGITKDPNKTSTIEEFITFKNDNTFSYHNMSFRDKYDNISYPIKNIIDDYKDELMELIVDVTLNGEITEEDEAAIKDYISGQNSDGLGEGFEQQDIRVEEGILNVHFWSFAYDYQIYNEEEFDYHIESQGMGAM